MPLNTPNDAQEIENRSKVDVQNSLPNANPFLPNSWIGSLINTFANRIFDFYQNLNLAVDQTFWNTSTAEFLEEQASWFDVSRGSASQATGFLAITGVQFTNIPEGTEYISVNGLVFSTDEEISIGKLTIIDCQLSYISGTVTVDTTADHGWSSGMIVDIVDSDDIDYEGSFEITAIDADTFTYELGIVPASSTAEANVSAISAHAAITSEDFTDDANLGANSVLNLSGVIPGVDSSSRLDTSGTNGGATTENDEELRSNFLNKTRNPTANFNDVAIEEQVFKTDGVNVTRVFVQDVTPLIGQVTIYFMKDNDTFPIPNTTDLTLVKNQILTIKPSNTSSDDVIVSAPTPIDVDFSFISLDPSTTTMKTSIRENLEYHFQTAQDVGEDVALSSVEAVISTTIDFETGSRVSSYSLSTPVANVAISDDEIAVLGSVSF